MAMALDLKWEGKHRHDGGIRRIEAADEQDIGDHRLRLKP
jgi:hypothetical protein